MTDEAERPPHIAASIGADYADSFAACRELLSAMFVDLHRALGPAISKAQTPEVVYAITL